MAKPAERLRERDSAPRCPDDVQRHEAAALLDEAEQVIDAILNERWSPAGRSEEVSDMARATLAKLRGEQ